jgi:hypothetical protein
MIDTLHFPINLKILSRFREQADEHGTTAEGKKSLFPGPVL